MYSSLKIEITSEAAYVGADGAVVGASGIITSAGVE